MIGSLLPLLYMQPSLDSGLRQNDVFKSESCDFIRFYLRESTFIGG